MFSKFLIIYFHLISFSAAKFFRWIGRKVLPERVGDTNKFTNLGFCRGEDLMSFFKGRLKVHKHEKFFLTFFAETESLWSQGPVTRDF
jgi:hypothetical protein